MKLKSKKLLFILAITLFSIVIYKRQAAAVADTSSPSDTPAPDQYSTSDTPETTGMPVLTSIDDWIQQNVIESDAMSIPMQIFNLRDITPNVRAFIRTIATCEGTINAGGYAALYGSTPGRIKTFTGWADHPRLAQRISSTDARYTSAAGLLQWMAISPIPGGGSTKVDTWDRMKAKLNLPDFSPDSQDRAAVELFAQFGALGDIQAGRVLDAARKLRSQWASLPGAGYGQGERTTDYVAQAFTNAGGVLA